LSLTDRYGRGIHYLRVSVTDRCNYRCVYCMPAEGIPLKSHADILSYETITRIAGTAAGLGFDKVRLTGGEPLVRKNIEQLVSMLGRIEGLKDISMSTNGSLLTPKMAREFRAAGLARINISLDTLDEKKFSEITRGGELEDSLSGIDAALTAGLDPVKINMIVSEETIPAEIDAMRRFCEMNGLVLQTIKQFSLYNRKDELKYPHVFDRPQPCEECNKLRLTADGYLKPCLFSNKEIRVDLENIEGSIRRAVESKPQKGTCCENRIMCQIGG
jgi:cyclic pyranopterin phosphate synthase